MACPFKCLPATVSALFLPDAKLRTELPAATLLHTASPCIPPPASVQWFAPFCAPLFITAPPPAGAQTELQSGDHAHTLLLALQTLSAFLPPRPVVGQSSLLLLLFLCCCFGFFIFRSEFQPLLGSLSVSL